MAKNQDGEYELVLGNHQLLGVFFIVVCLIAVFFAMGYLMGRNSPLPVSAEAAPSKSNSKPLVVDSPAPRTHDPDEAPPQAVVSTQPQTTEPASPEPAPVKVASTPKPVSSSTGQPTPGTYLQLAAINQKMDAEAMVDVLHSKKFPALTAEIPERPGTFRVLVGPLDDADVNKTRADLQSASFPGKEAIKKTF